MHVIVNELMTSDNSHAFTKPVVFVCDK